MDVKGLNSHLKNYKSVWYTPKNIGKLSYYVLGNLS